MGGCQNYGPFLGYPKYEVPYYNGDPKRDHNFDNHPDVKSLPKVQGSTVCVLIQLSCTQPQMPQPT